MDPRRFDALAISLSMPRSRRAVGLTAFAGLVGLTGTDSTAKTKKKKKGKPGRSGCDTLPRNNVYKLSCQELKQRSDDADMGVWYLDNEGKPTCGLGAHGVTVPYFTFDPPSYTSTKPVKLGMQFTTTTLDVRTTMTAHPVVTSVDWVRVGDEADSRNAGCAKLEQEFEDYVRDHEAQHVADAHEIAAEWNRTWTPPTSGYTARGPNEQAARDALKAKIVAALNDQVDILEERQRNRSTDYHRSNKPYAQPFTFDCARCAPCAACREAAARRGGRTAAVCGEDCGAACCLPCHACLDPAASICAAEACEACEECRDGECVAVDCGDPCLECVENACVPKVCEACEECRSGECVPIDCGGPCFECAENECRPKTCGECEECAGGACVPVDCGACFECVANECRPKPCGECEVCVDDACVPKPAEAGACTGSNGSCFRTPGACGAHGGCYCRQAAGGSGRCGNVCTGITYVCRRTCAECPSTRPICINLGCCEVNYEQWVGCVAPCVDT